VKNYTYPEILCYNDPGILRKAFSAFIHPVTLKLMESYILMDIYS